MAVQNPQSSMMRFPMILLIPKIAELDRHRASDTDRVSHLVGAVTVTSAIVLMIAGFEPSCTSGDSSLAT